MGSGSNGLLNIQTFNNSGERVKMMIRK